MPLRFWEIGIGSLAYIYLKVISKDKVYFNFIKKLSGKITDFLFIVILLLLFLPKNYSNFIRF